MQEAMDKLSTNTLERPKKPSYVALVISHKRPECVTARTLLDSGYDGDWYIVADSDDDTMYEQIWSEDRVLRFDKHEMANITDTCDNFGEMTASVYARNFCLMYAMQIDVDCLILLDDDIKKIRYRYERDGQLRSMPVKHLTDVFEKYIEYLINAGIVSISFVTNGMTIGGLKSKVAKEGWIRNPAVMFMINMRKSPEMFRGTVQDDIIYNETSGIVGGLCLAAMPIMIDPGPVFDNKGGMFEYYHSGRPQSADDTKVMSDYMQRYNFSRYPHMVFPSQCYWQGGKINRFIVKDNFPCIIGKDSLCWHGDNNSNCAR